MDSQNKKILPFKKFGKLYYSSEVPNNGMLNLKWSIKKISAFLRCMDFKPLNFFPNQYFYSKKKKYYISNYKILTTKPSKKKKFFLNNKIIIKEGIRKIFIYHGKKNN